mmetsp:Transcript_12483/g.18755  ORF Transcript_12483/g.18755 Transcript_12483/m.18755 type:complete len:91 (-) Transcript_12483:1184-1456(-)
MYQSHARQICMLPAYHLEELQFLFKMITDFSTRIGGQRMNQHADSGLSTIDFKSCCLLDLNTVYENGKNNINIHYYASPICQCSPSRDMH